MKVAVVFFGLSRDLSKTQASIESNILQPIKAASTSLTTLASLNVVDKVYSPRAGEEHVPARNEQILTLGAAHYVLARQDAVDISRQLAAARTFHDPYLNNYASITNTLHQLASLKRGWRALHALEPGGFDCYCFIRPDLRYEDPLDFPDLSARLARPGAIVLPSWHSWTGLNDRFAVAGHEAARHYALRFDFVEAFCRRNLMHAENFLAWSMARNGCLVGDLPLRATRVRANGMVVDEDFSASRIALPKVPARFRFSPVESPDGAGDPSLSLGAPSGAAPA